MIDNPDALKDFIVKILTEKKAENIVVMPLEKDVPLAKYMIFASGRSVKNISATAEFLALELKHNSYIKPSIEGLKNSDWVLLDAGDIIVHLFHPEARSYLKLEEFWEKKNK